MKYQAASNRYQNMQYRKCGDSGLKLPLISLGLWHNFGGKIINPESKKVLFKAFDFVLFSKLTSINIIGNFFKASRVSFLKESAIITISKRFFE